MFRLTVFIIAIINIDVTAIALRYPGGMTGVALKALGMFFNTTHCHHRIRAFPGIVYLQLFQQWNIEIISCNERFVAL